MVRALGPIAAFVVWLACASAPAGAATVEMITKYAGRDGGEDQYQQYVVYTAAAGEANALVVSVDYERVVFQDSGAQIEVRGGCTQTTAHAAVCAPPDDFGTIEARLGDGDDSGRIDAAQSFHPVTRLDGGPDDDTIQGGIGFETLIGGLGDDVVDGGAGGDTINGGGGRDELRAGAVSDGFDFIEDGDTDENADADVIVGHGVGYYTTTVSYRARKAPVTVDLGAGTAGAPGEGDTLVGGIRLVEGGTGSDTLLGTDRDDYIRGNAGDDVIRGRSGNDGVLGQAGADRVSGGPGNDVHGDESDDARDVESCGPGFDFVSASDARDLLRRDCEEGAWSAMPIDEALGFANRITVQPAMRRRSVTFRSSCNTPPKCTARIELRTPESRRLLGTRRFEIERSSEEPEKAPRRPIRVPLTDRGVARLARGGYVRVVITSRYDCQGCLNPPKPARTGFTTYMRR
jgi:hypothetical protein